MKWNRHRVIKCWIGNVRVEIFSKTRRAWTLLFETGTYLYFLFIYFFCSRMFLVWSFFWDASFGIGNQTPPSTATKNGVFTEFFVRSDVAVLRQSNSHARPRTERSLCEVERRDSSVKRRGKNISQPLAFLDLGQSANGANPDGCAKEQPLKILRAADIILLECSET